MQQLEAALSFNVEDRVREISCDTLVITGDNDVVVPTQNSRNLSDAIPNARLEIIKDSGHMSFIEKPSEFNRVVSDFLEGEVK
jgi:pimeloyl-ACP methyl ester carboxylesterase